MLQVLPDSDIPNTCFSFEKNFLCPDIPSNCLFQDPRRPIDTKPYCPQQLAGYPSAPKNGQSRVRNWLKPHESPSRAVVAMSSKRPAAQKQLWRENAGGWREPFAPFESQPHRVQSYELQHQSAPPSQCLPADSRAVSMPDVGGQRMAWNKCLAQTNQGFNNKAIKAEDPSRTMFHSTPRPNVCLATNSFTSFTDTEGGRDTASGFDCMENLKGEKASSDIGDPSFYQIPSLMGDRVDGISPFQIKPSPEASSVSTNEDSFTSTSASVPWPTHKVPSQWSLQQEAWPGQFAWTHMPPLPNGTHSSDFGNMELDNPLPLGGDVSDPPTLDNSLLGTEPALAPTCRSDFDFAFNREHAASTPFFGISNTGFADNEHAYRLDHSLYGSEDRSHLEASENDARQERLNFQAISCHGETRNAFLIECKRRGLSYKDIKKIGGFKEAESTLRGRFRTLTKSKEQRVRKPQWQPKDVSCPWSGTWIFF